MFPDDPSPVFGHIFRFFLFFLSPSTSSALLNLRTVINIEEQEGVARPLREIETLFGRAFSSS